MESSSPRTMLVKAMSLKKKQLWIGYAHVKEPDRHVMLGDDDEAFVNVIALAVNKSDFRGQVKKAVESLDLVLLQLKKAETLELRLSKHSIHKDLSKLAKRVERSGDPAFDVFATFKHGT